MLHLILLVLAFVLAVVEGMWGTWATPRSRPHLGWLAVAAAMLAFLLVGR